MKFDFSAHRSPLYYQRKKILRYLGHQEEKSHGVVPVRTRVRRLGAGRLPSPPHAKLPQMCGSCMREARIESLGHV